MHRIDGAGHVNNLFVSEDPATNRPPTEITPEIMNAFQQELAAIVEWSGAALDKADNGQVLTALIAKFADRVAAATKAGVQNMTYSAALAGGAANAITAVYDPPITALVHGMSVRVRAASANTTTTPTFTPNSVALAAKTIVKGNNLALVAGDISGAGHWLDFQWDQTLDKWVLLNPAKGISITTVAAASETVSGTVELATIAEVQAGTDAVRAVTPAGLASLTSNNARAGLVEMATWAETLAGTDDWRAVTPAGLLNALLGAGGTSDTDYFKFPYRDKTNGVRRELIVQIGSVGTLTGNNGMDTTFPIAFPNAFLAGHVTAVVSTDADGPTVCYRSPTVSGMRINNGTTDTAVSVKYIVIGY